MREHLRSLPRAVRLVLRCAVGAGLFLTVLFFDTLAHQTFREPKLSVLLTFGGGILILGGLWNAAAGFAGRRFLLPPSPLWALIPAGLLLLVQLKEEWGAVSSMQQLVSAFPLKSSYQLYVLAPVVAWLLVFSAAACAFRGVQDRSYLACCVFLAVAAETGIVLTEVVGNLIGRQLNPVAWRAEFDLMGQVVKEAVYGTIGNPNFVSGFLAIGGVALLGVFFSTTSRWVRVWTALLIACLLLCIISARSKGGLLAFAVGSIHLGLASFYLRRSAKGRNGLVPHGRTVAAAALIGIILLTGAAGWLLADRSASAHEPSYLNRWLETLTLRGDSIAVRALLAETGFRMWEESRWLGLGPGEFKIRFLDVLREMVQGPDSDLYAGRVARLHSLRATHLHNEYLQILVEWGIVGLAFVELFIVWCFVRAWDGIRSASSERDRWLRIGFLSAFWAGLGGCLIDLPLHRPAQTTMMAVMLGACMAHPGRIALDPSQRRTPLTNRWRRIPCGLALAVLCGTSGLWLLWDSTARYVSLREVRYARAVLSGEMPGGDSRKALETIRRAMSRVPGEGDYAFYLASAQASFDPQSAVETIRRIRPISDHPDLAFVEARAQIERNNFSAAEPLLEFLAILDRDRPGLHYLRGRVYEGTGRLPQARSAYLTEVHWAEGQTGRPPGDSSPATRARPVDRDLLDVFLRLAQLLEKSEDFDLAVSYYNKFLQALGEQTPSYPLAQLRLAQMYRDRFYDYDQAEKFFRSALEVFRRTNNSQEARRVEQDLENLARARSAGL